MRRTRSGASRPAFTMIECCAALAVFAAILLLWQPIVNAANHLQPQDGELVEVLAANRELDELASRGKIGVSGESLVIAANDKTYVVDDYYSKANGKIVRMSTTNGGYMPLVSQAESFEAHVIVPGVVQYKITLQNGAQFTGVLAAEKDAPTKTRQQKEQLPADDESVVPESKEVGRDAQ
ncbi:hypothetical protein PQ472_08035 [Lacticaseibacillus pabuli]|uniref:Prepilin-type N-terminal cleavage/methylation domain-containing protein n=1 Tax=Lacticaseibacillus pabuli TaxID=3025672 RepID=A0ABY7WQ29_9LACO|nr:hypothetical protein [Lacticaseibacillus sp. KACC 23028]WDF81874.1 hypothetical protein PQ472_08035 [Lacticaseibacillus sp. KACC 23028]